MDIKVKAVLDFIQSQKGCEHSIIAGGAVRDYQFELEPRDYDFFVPTSKKLSLRTVIELVKKEFKIEEIKDKSINEYGTRLSGVNEIVFEGKVIDIIGKPIENNEEFGSKVISDFDFGINMAFYNGLYIDDTSEHFQTDLRNYRMTLINLESIAHLPRAIERYNNFRDKAHTRGINIRFDSPNLKWSKPIKKEKKIDYYKMTADTVPDLVFWNNEPPVREVQIEAVNPVGEIPLQMVPARRPWNVLAPQRMVIGDFNQNIDPARVGQEIQENDFDIRIMDNN